MLRSLLEFLSNGLQSTPLIALSASFLWGIFSILLSPCHLASIPLIVGFISEQGTVSTKRAFLLSILFSIGILITVGLIGLVTGLIGRVLGDIGSYGNYFVAIIFFVMGLHLLGIIPFPFLGKSSQPTFKKKGLLAAFILGLVFGIALGPCTFAYMAPMLGITFKIAATNLFHGITILFAYGIGHCSVIVFAGTFTEIIQRYLNWNEKSKALAFLRKISGALVIVGGIYLLWRA